MRHARSVTTLAISGFVKDQMIRSGAPGDRIRVLHLPAPRVDPELSAKPLSLGPPRFVYAGRLNEQKGVHCLIRAMHEVEADVELDIAGDGPFEGAARRLCAELKIESRVKFHGWLAERQIHDLISAARAVVFPSVWHEPAGLVPLEAGALGRASISTRVGGIPEYAQRLGNSILVEPNSPAALSEAIRQVARDASLAQRLGEAGAVAARDYFSLDRHVAELAAVYRSRS
jgi:glycosyltransferase involved in cell wall biosynthesis